MRRRVLLALALACVPVSLTATTLVVFRTPERIIFATDAAAVGLFDGRDRRPVNPGCKIQRSGRFFFLSGGFLQVDVVAKRIAPARTVAEAMAAVESDRSIRDRIIANRGLYVGRQPGSPLMTVVIAGPDLTLGVFMISLKAAAPFEVIGESGTCPGRLCPTGGYYLVGEPGDAPPNPLVEALPPWFYQADGAAALRFIEAQIDFAPTFAKRPIDVLMIDAGGARWIDRESGSSCAAIP